MKAVIITGGTRGIGRAIVDEVARQMLAGDPYIAGARLVVTYRSDTRSAEALLQTLRCAGLDADVIEMDLEVPESINTFSSWVADTFESVGVLVNSVSSFTKRSVSDEDVISKAKLILKETNGFSELQAHKYLQRESMKMGKKIAVLAQEIINDFM